jgi:hypothetical protein
VSCTTRPMSSKRRDAVFMCFIEAPRSRLFFLTPPHQAGWEGTDEEREILDWSTDRVVRHYGPFLVRVLTCDLQASCEGGKKRWKYIGDGGWELLRGTQTSSAPKATASKPTSKRASSESATAKTVPADDPVSPLPPKKRKRTESDTPPGHT